MPLFQSPLFQVPWNSSRSIRGHCGTAREPWSQHSSPMHTVQQRWGGCCLHHCAVFHPGFLISTCCICGGLFTLWFICVFTQKIIYALKEVTLSGLIQHLPCHEYYEKHTKSSRAPELLSAHLTLSKLRNNRFGNSSDYKLPPICTLQDIAHRKQKPNNRVSLPKIIFDNI